MESICKYTRQCREEKKEANEEELIQMLRNFVDDDGDIDFIFPQYYWMYGDYVGTILHYSIINSYKQVVEYALKRGANIAVKIIWKHPQLKYRNALDLFHLSGSYHIIEILKERSLELYSSFDLTRFHLNCALENCSNTEMKQYIQNNATQVNAAISAESPIWPGMTPIMIAAKFENTDLVTHLLDFGADPIAQDPEGNTALHYLYVCGFFDKRLFALDATNTFGSLTGRSHFHLACNQGLEALDIVKRYLDQGISPDLPTQSLIGCSQSNFASGQVGLHIAVDRCCSKLVRLLLDYGADIDAQDSRGDRPIEYIFEDYLYNWNSIKCLCLFIEGGSNMMEIDMNILLEYILYVSLPRRNFFLSCIMKIKTLNEDLVPEKLMDVYTEVLKKSDGWEEAEYVGRCSEELTTLSSLGLRQILDGSIVVKPDFKKRFGWLDCFDFKLHPIYGSLLKTKTKQKLLELQKKRRKIPQAVPQVQMLFQSVCNLPHLCIENILWNLSCKELDKFVS